MDLFKSMKIAATGLKAQSGRMRVIAENLANADSTAVTPGGDPYRRKVPTFKVAFDRDIGATVVEPGRIKLDQKPFNLVFDPGHPAADAKGYVKTPNVSSLVEGMDMREAQRSYEANLNVVQASRRMLTRTLEILKV